MGFFGFLKKHILGHKSVQEWSRTNPKALLEAKLCKRSPRVEILRLQEETTEIWPITSEGRAINKSFLYVEISQKFQREVNAWAISYILRDFGPPDLPKNREKCFRSSRVFQYMSYYKNVSRLSCEIEQI